MHQLIYLLSSISFASDPYPNTTSSAAGADSMWVNPANLSFRKPPSLLFSFQYSESQSLVSYGNAFGPLGIGVKYQSDNDLNSTWVIANALSFKLDEHLRTGFQIDWNIPSNEATYTSWDFGLGWRPLPYLGFGVVSKDIGSNNTLNESYRFGPTINLFNSRLMLSTDFEIVAEEPSDYTTNYLLVARPIQGLQLRFQSTDFDEIGAYLGFGFGEGFYGFSGSSSLDTPSDYQASVMVGRGIDEKKIISRGREVAVFKMSGAYPYHPSASLFSTPAESYTNLLHRIYTACRDPSVQGIAFHIENLRLSMAQIEEVQQLLFEGKSRGKKIIVYLDEDASNSAYFLASAADRILIHPSSNLEIIGISSTRLYLKEMFEIFGIKPEFIKRSDYKSAPEQYTNRESSSASQEQTSELLQDFHSVFVDMMERSRGLSDTQIQDIIDGAPYTAEEAKQKLLVDKIAYPDQLKAFYKEYFDNKAVVNDAYGISETTDDWDTPRKIALLYVTGVISSGESSNGGLLGGAMTGSETIINQIDEIIDSNKFEAVVIRVDSPGGSAFASEDIWRAIENLKAEEIPVIVSMGGAAASGGYYVSCGADKIFAESTTITGSIGVYSGKFSAEILLDRFGVNIEEMNTGRNSGLYSMHREWDSNERARLEQMIDATYMQFKERVSDGRDLTMEEVEQVARGRVWSGMDAQSEGLVDEIGSLYDAISYAKTIAKLPNKASVHVWSIGETGPLSVKSHQIQNALSPWKVIQDDLNQIRKFQTENIWLIDPNSFMYP